MSLTHTKNNEVLNAGAGADRMGSRLPALYAHFASLLNFEPTSLRGNCHSNMGGVRCSSGDVKSHAPKTERALAANGEITERGNSSCVVGKSKSGRKGQRSSREGSVTTLFVASFLPIIAVWIFILEMRKEAANEMYQQRTLDRCLYQVLEERCNILSRISATNRKLIQLRSAYRAAVAGEAIPGVGKAFSVLAKATLKQTANVIVGIQSTLLWKDKALFPRLLSCKALPLFAVPIQTHRKLALEADMSRFPQPLIWDNHSDLAFLWLRKIQRESFGFCKPKKGTATEWRGEKYLVDLGVPRKVRAWSSSSVSSLLR